MEKNRKTALVLISENIRQLVSEINKREIQKEDIATLVKLESQYALIYYQ